MTDQVLVAMIGSGTLVTVSFGLPYLNARLTRKSLTRHLGSQNGRGDMYAIVERIDERLEEHLSATIEKAHPQPETE